MKSRMTQHRSSNFLTRFLCVALLCCIASSALFTLHAQPLTTSSPARWTTPRGPLEANRSQSFPSVPQRLDSLIMRWSSTSLAGDIQPLIGNVINDAALPGNPYAPQEIMAVVGGELLVVDAMGRMAKRTRLPSFVSSASAVFDENNLPAGVSARYPGIIALESIERRDTKDSLAVAYLAALDSAADSLAIIKRLTINVAPFSPNLFASIRPFFAEAQGTSTSVFCTVDMSSPSVDSTSGKRLPFFRGITAFSVDLRSSARQLSVNDTIINQFTVAPGVSFTQPAVAALVPGLTTCVLPCWPDTLTTSIPYLFDPTRSTTANRAYLTGAILQSPLSPSIAPLELVPDSIGPGKSTRPRLSPTYIRVTDALTGSMTPYILVAEEYVGRNGSQGTARLNLFDFTGAPVTGLRDTANPSFAGKNNHAWSVSTGNVDGDTANSNLPFYPHNPGDEIIVTQTTHELACPGSRLMVLRYRTGARIQKETKRTEYLYPLDTLVTQALPGWVACVSDLDSSADKKAEIILVDGSSFMVLRMRDYADPRFTQEDAFDTVYTASFRNENINALSVADVDGDGRHDIVVTTNMRCAVFGQPIRNNLQVLLPGRNSGGRTEICEGDSITLSWRNLFKSQSDVRVMYQDYVSDTVPGLKTRVISPSKANTSDTITMTLLPDSLFAGTMGRFIVQSIADSSVRDSSCVVVFNKSSIVIDSALVPVSVVATNRVTLRGRVHCIDSVILSYTISTDTTRFYQNELYHERTDSLFAIDFSAPCVSFPLQGAGSVPVRIRAMGRNATTKRWVSSPDVRTAIVPAGIHVNLTKSIDTLCADQNVLWYLPPDSSICAVMIVSTSTDGGRTFVVVDSVPRGENRWEYKASKTSPDSIRVRLWCPGSCYRIDTTLRSTKPKLVKKIAPNPFEPGVESCGIYSSPLVNGRATLRIYDEHEDLVRELVSDETRDRDRVYCDYWDGTTAQGLPVTDGMYYLVISYSDGSKEYHPIFVRRR